MGERIDNFRDAVRTAPIGLGLAAMNAAAGIYSYSYAAANGVEFPDSFPEVALYATPGLATAAGIALGARAMVWQFRLRSKMERNLEDYGFDRHDLTPTTKTWCDRQTARVVCERAGVLPLYEQLCEDRKDGAEFTRIPHI